MREGGREWEENTDTREEADMQAVHQENSFWFYDLIGVGPDARTCSQKISIILPPEVELPTPDSYEAIPNEIIVQLIDEVTKTVFQSVFR